MEITILGERVETVERALEILEDSRKRGHSEGIAHALYAITQIGQGTPAAAEAATEIEMRWERSREDARKRTAGEQLPVLGAADEQKAAAELAARWEKSRAEARLRTQENAAENKVTIADARFDPYASQRHKRGRKSHLAAAINQNIHDHPAMGCVWVVLLSLGFIGSFVMMMLGK